MLANGIKQTTTSTGTGNLTLTAVAGNPTFADAFALGQLFAYALLDASGQFIEAGDGYLSNSTTLVRARVCATYVAGTYSKANVAANLSGTVSVICTPHAATLNSGAPTVDGQTAGINRLLTSAGRSVSQSPQGLSTNTVYYVPFVLRMGALITSFCYNITGAVAGTAQLGIYGLNEKGYVGKLLGSATIADTSTTGLKVPALATPLFLPPGDYFTAIVVSSGITGTSYTTNGGQAMGGSPFGYSGINAIDFRTEAAGSAVLPAQGGLTTSSTTYGAMHPPCVFLGVQ